MSQQYHIPPPGHVRYASYNTSVTASPVASPYQDRAYEYYVPQQRAPPVSPSSRHPPRRHSRRESFSTPQAPGGWPPSAGYHAEDYYYTTTVPGPAAMPQQRQPYVSNIDRLREKSRRYTTSGPRGGGDGYGHHQRHASMQSPTPRIIVDTSDEADDSQFYTYIKPRTGHTKKKYGDTDPYSSYRQDYDDSSSDSQPQRSRAHRSSYPSKSKPSPASPKAKAPKLVRKVATEEDALRAGVPAGYSVKNWDPTERPIVLLGSVFDAYSLGKWIFDWTVHRHGATAPLSDMAADLWLLLIKLGGKMKRAKECLPRIREGEEREMVIEFFDSAERLWERTRDLLSRCEKPMMMAGKKSASKGTVTMSTNSGCEFVDSIFGRDRELQRTEKLMTAIQLWNHRFTANCEMILELASPKEKSKTDPRKESKRK